MKYVICSILLLLTFLTRAWAQESVNSSGADLSGSTANISYSIGQVVFHTHSVPGASFAEGVQQPYEISTISGIDIPAIILQLSAYPNPTKDILNLRIGNYNAENLTLQLFDLSGKLLLEKRITESNTMVDMHPFALATYFLTVAEKQRPIKTFKIIKH